MVALTNLGGSHECESRVAHDVELAVLLTVPLAVAVGALATPAQIGRVAGGCWFHAAFGVPCPTCGITRALVALAHLDWRSALAVQPLVTLLTIATMLYVPWALGVVGRGWSPFRIELRGARGRPLRWALVVAVMANWAYLIHAGV
jgi:hypothetical protein